MAQVRTSRVLTFFACVAIAFGSGCATPSRVSTPLTAGPLGGNAQHDRAEFWYQLARRPAVSNDEAFHALLLYFGDAAPDYATRVASLREHGMLPDKFERPADETVDRGTLAVALAKAMKIEGGVTMRVLGATPRYADRALQTRDLLPPGSPNQTVTGGQFVAIFGRVEDYQRGDPARSPAALLPGEINGDASGTLDPQTLPAEGDGAPTTRPLMLNLLNASAILWWQDAAATQPATAPTAAKPVKLKAIITGVEGDAAEIRKGPAEPWARARVGQSLGEAGEIRTGPKSAVRFVIPPDQVYTLDRQGSCTVLQAVFDGKRVTADVGMQQGRVRLDVAPIAKPLPKPEDPAEPQYRFEQAGVEHGIMIRSPNAALAVRGTLVSLYDEPGFTPEAVSLTGKAQFRNTRRQLVAFGGTAGRTTIRGDQSGAAEQALAISSLSPTSEVARNDFDTQQTALLINRGGSQRGDVLIGNSRTSDAQLVPTLPGALNFVIRWDGGSARAFNDLNLVVFGPGHTADAPDFVGNPPFGVSLRPGDADAEQLRAARYPRTSRSGGRISKNHIGPEGLEFASWPATYTPGNYRAVVYNLLDAVPPPAETTNPVQFTLDVFLNKRVLINTVTRDVGELQTSPAFVVPVPASTAAATARAAKGRADEQAKRGTTAQRMAKTQTPAARPRSR